MKENVIRTMNNMSQVPSWQTHLTSDEVDYWLANYSDIVFCNGQARRVCFEKVTDKTYKAFTQSVR